MVSGIFKVVMAILAAVPAMEKILEHPAIARLLGALVGLVTRTEAEKAVIKVRKGIKVRKETTRQISKAIKDAKRSRTRQLENIINRPS